MYTADALTDLHERTHQSLQKLLDHCAGFTQEDLARELDGFGQPSIRIQLHHVIGAEAYWIGVLQGQMLTEEREEDYASIDALRAFRTRVSDGTSSYLRAASDEDLNARRKVITWGDKEAEHVPAHVLLRTQTHIYQHQGQVAAMARLLGRPIPAGLDFPLT